MVSGQNILFFYMVSPNLIKRNENSQAVEVNANAKKLFQVIYSESLPKDESRQDDIPRIRVSALVSRLAFFYEKVRNAVDYEEEHLLRKNAISRILRRQVMIESVIKDVDSPKIAEHLIVELIRGRYLPNNEIPEAKIGEIALLLDKYIRLKDQMILKINAEIDLKKDINRAKDLVNEKNRLVRWTLALAACEIEDVLGQNRVKQMVVNSMFDVLSQNISLPAGLDQSDLEIQIYLSIGRNYLKLDKDMLSFVLFKYYNSDWLDLGRQGGWDKEVEAKVGRIASGLMDLRQLVEKQLAYSLGKQLDKITRAYSLYFSILAETINEDPAKTYNELQQGEKSFIASIKKVCQKKYKKAKNRLWRAAFRSIIYIFLTKSIFAVLIEVPAIRWLGETLNPISLGINIAFPAILLFLIVFFTRTPNGDNTDKIIAGIKEVAFQGQERRQPIILRPDNRRNWLARGIFNIIYAASFCFSVYVIIRVLDFINFNWVSITIFLFFLAFVSFFSIVVTRGVKELMIVERRENLGSFLIDLFYMPIILVGRWLSRNASKLNVFIFIFDFIIEAPFKILVEIAEDWTKYVKERRDNMQ